MDKEQLETISEAGVQIAFAATQLANTDIEDPQISAILHNQMKEAAEMLFTSFFQPLKWEHNVLAQTPFGTYIIQKKKDGPGCFFIFDGHSGETSFQGRVVPHWDTAKGAALTDYFYRVRKIFGHFRIDGPKPEEDVE